MSHVLPAEIPFVETDWNHKEANIDLELIDCTLCGSADYKTIMIERDYKTGIGGPFRIVQCDDCGLTYTNPRPTPETIGVFYGDEYVCYASRKEDTSWQARWRHDLEHSVLQTYYGLPAEQLTLATKLKAWWGNLRIKRNRQRMGWIPYRGEGRLLDFGCGAGHFLKDMKSHGWNVQGLDFSEMVAKQVTEETGIPVHTGTLPHPNVQPESFDVVSMWNALEHVYSPSETIRAAKDVLAPGGLMVVGVPNSASFGFETFKNDWFALDVPRHLTHFTPDTLTQVLEKEGLRIHSLTHISRPAVIRKSVAIAKKNGTQLSLIQKMMSNKQVATHFSDRAEKQGKACFIRAIAEKI